MPVDRRKGLQAAERLLKQGKLKAALTELQRVSESAPDDLLTLNRLGDLLARQGRNEEAIGYYRKIATQFAEGGFLPKSVAIQKKILRIDPHNLDSLVALGELYLTQELHGEARNYLLHAANRHIEAKNFGAAQQIYERLIEAEPGELRHRVRLAEARAAEGDSEFAGREMVSLGRSLLEQGSTSEAERVFGRAAELVPGSPEALLGSVDCLVANKREEEALARLEAEAKGSSAPPVLVGELACHYARVGRSDEALALIAGTAVLEIAHRTWLRLFGYYLEKDDVDVLWSALDPIFVSLEEAHAEPLAALLQQLDEVEERGHLPALERLYRLRQKRDDTAAEATALESLVSAYRARSMTQEAARLAGRLRELVPEAQADAPSSSPAAAKRSSALHAGDRPRSTPRPGPTGRPSADLPLEAEAPAVPLSRSDEEFVTGRVTQSEVLEKYGLKPQALEQVESVTARFPGHVKAQELRVDLLRGANEPDRLAEALAGLALARRAAGDSDGALAAAAQAVDGQLGDESRQLLQQCRLIEGGEAGDVLDTEAPEPPALALEVDSNPTPADVPFEAVETPPVAVVVEHPADVDADSAEVAIEYNAVAALTASATEAAAAPVAEIGGADAGADIVIDFDARDAPDAKPVSTREPGADMLKEIQEFLNKGALDEARQRVQALRTLGYVGPSLDALDGRIESPPEPSSDPVAVASPAESVPAETADVDLSAITAALENELLGDGVDSGEPIVPEEDPEQSMSEIFSSFKAAVQEQVSDDDHGTHYDLAIAYKEMGLVDEAISEFELASSSPEFHRQACTMIGLCHWEREELDVAAGWYRKAIEAARSTDEGLSHLRYDLGEVLLQSGDRKSALAEFQEVLLADPDHREVRARVCDLEQQLQT